MIRRETGEGGGYTVVRLNGVSHVFAAAVPRGGGTLGEQADDALRTIEAVIEEEGTRGQIVHQAVFLRNPGDLEACRSIMREFYGDQMPATTYISQPPCSEKRVAIEALGVGRGDEDVAIERVGEQLVVVRHGGVSWIHCGQVVPDTAETGVYGRTLSAFQRLERLLQSRGSGFHQVVRTWLYLGGIVREEGGTQRYMEMNRARTAFYEGIRFPSAPTPSEGGGADGADGAERIAYPASTGIGTENHDVVMSAIAVDADPRKVRMFPLENPRQTSAFDYSMRYGPTSPKFSRAMVLTSGAAATIFVSGTASITDSETRHAGDVARQTHQTLDNIEELVSEENFARHGAGGLGAKLGDLAFLRVYIKRREDFAATRAVCEARLGRLPTVYATADICRPDLLVEIEAVAFSACAPA